MSEKLKPCPFCGGQAKIYTVQNLYKNRITTRIFCTKCGARTGTCLSERAPKLWNARKETPMQKRIAELEAENGRLREALKEIAEFTNDEYEKRIPTPSCVVFMTIKRYAEETLKGANHDQQKI